MVRIQLRRDTAANWTSSNPTLRAGEVGIETDTLKFKVGNGTSTWTQITAYANVTPSSLSTSLSEYLLSADLGTAGGPAALSGSGTLLIPEDAAVFFTDPFYSYTTSLSATEPTADRTITFKNEDGTVAFVADIPSTTDTLTEGSTNKYFTDERAQDAVATALAAGTHTNLTVTYNDGANSISLAAAPGYVDEQAVDAVAAALAAGTHTNISVSYNDAGDAISLTGAVTYTDENAQDAIGNALGTGLSYNDTTGAVSVDTSTIQARVTNVTDTEIGYLDGVNSGIQTQLDTKLASSTAATTYAPIASPTFTGTVSGVTATHVGLGNVNNTSDANKPVSTATQTALDLKAPLASPTFTGTVAAASLTLSGDLTVNGTTTTLNSTTISVDDKNIELGSVATPSDATADGGGITLKGATDKTFNWVDATDAWTSSEHVNLASGKSLYLNGTLLKDATETLTNKTLTSPVINTPTGITKSDVGLANVDNTTDAGKPVSTATQTALDLKLASATAATTYAPIASPTFTGTVTIPSGSAITGVPYLTTANTFTGGVQQITTASAATIGLIVKGTDSQTADLQEWQNSAGTILSKIGSDGRARIGGSNGIGANIAASTLGAGSVDPSWTVITVKGAASQTANLQEWQNSAGTALASVTTGGFVNGSAYRQIGGNSNAFGTTTISGTLTSFGSGGNAAIIPIVIHGAASQTASLQEWRNSTGSILSKIESNGAITAPSLTLSSTALATTSGGTGLSTYTTGDILYSSASNTLAKLAAGTDGYILTLASGIPSWAAAPITLPSQTGNTGKYLTTDGTDATWGTLVVPITTGTATVSANTATTVDTTALSAFTSIEYMVSLKQGSKVRTSKVVVQTDGTSVDMTEFAITETGGTIAGVVISATTVSTNGVLQVTVTDAATTNVTVKFSKIAL